MDPRETMIQGLDQGREKLNTVLAGIERDTEIYPGWTTKQLLAHISGWDDAALHALRAHAANESARAIPSAERGIDFYNAQTVAERDDLSYEQIVIEWGLVRDQLKAILRQLTDEQLAQTVTFPWGAVGPIERIIHILSHHEGEHAAEIAQRWGLPEP